MYFISVDMGMNLLLSLFLLLRGAFVLSIGFFALSFPVSLIRKRLAEKFKLKWFSSIFIALFALSLLFTAVAYLYPMALVSGQWDLGPVPEELVAGQEQVAMFWLYSAFKILLVAAVLAVMFSPFVLLGSLLLEKLEKRKLNSSIKTFIAVFLCTLLGSFLLLFAFNWIPSGIIFYLYYG